VRDQGIGVVSARRIYGLVIVLLVSLGVAIGIGFHVDSVLSQYGHLVDVVQQQQRLLRELTAEVAILASGRMNPNEVEVSWDRLMMLRNHIVSDEAAFRDGLEKLAQGTGSLLDYDDIQELTLAINGAWSTYQSSLRSIFNDPRGSDGIIHLQDFAWEVSRLLDELAATLNRRVERVQGRNRFVGWVMVILALCLVIWGVCIFREEYAQPMKEIVESLGGIAQGNLNQRLPEKGPPKMEELARDFNQTTEMVRTVLELGSHLASGDSFEEVFDHIYDVFHEYLPYDRMGVALIDPATKTIRAERAKSRVPVKLYTGYTIALHKTSLPRVIEAGQPRIISDLGAYLEEHPHSESTRYIVEEGMRSSLTMPLTVDHQPLGALFFSSLQPHAYNKEHVQFLQLAASSIARALEKGIIIGDIILTATMGFAKLAAFRDTETGEHLQRMRRYAAALAKRMAVHPRYEGMISEAFIREMYTFTPLHDIGKVGIPDHILLKPGKLTREEFEIMKRHTVIGAQALSEAEEEAERLTEPIFERAIEIAAYHHERYDGTGYPCGLVGEAIPLSARITAVADVFDALTSVRPYKPAYSFDQSAEMVISESGSHFDPGIVECFQDCLEEFHSIYTAFRDSSEDLTQFPKII